VLDLKRGLAAAEERARSELGMVLPSEMFYQLMPSRPDARAPAIERYTRGDAGGAVEVVGFAPGARTGVQAIELPAAKPADIANP
jgi:hypothetical protein